MPDKKSSQAGMRRNADSLKDGNQNCKIISPHVEDDIRQGVETLQ